MDGDKTRGRDSDVIAGRLAVYQGLPTPCPSSANRYHHWPFVVLDGSASFDTAAAPHGQALGTALCAHPLSEAAFRAAAGVWSAVDTDDVAEDFPMEVRFPATLPAVGALASSGAFPFQASFEGAFDSPAGAARDKALSDWIVQFCDEAVPAATYIAGNVDKFTTTPVHRNGVTYEIPCLDPELCGLVPNSTQRDKVARREYTARRAALGAAVPGVVVPFTILVRTLTCSVLASPQLPIAAESPCVQGCPSLADFAAVPPRVDDRQAVFAASSLGSVLGLKGHWAAADPRGPRAFVYLAADTTLRRSAVTHRLYCGAMRRALPCCRVGAPTATAQLVERFRPEFLQRHATTALSSDAGTALAMLNGRRDEMQRREACAHLRDFVVPVVAGQLCRDVRFCGIGEEHFRGGGLGNLMKSHGLNMRLLPALLRALEASRVAPTRALNAVVAEMAARAVRDRIAVAGRVQHDAHGLVIDRSAVEGAVRAAATLPAAEMRLALAAKYGAVDVGEEALSDCMDLFFARLCWLLGVKITNSETAEIIDPVTFRTSSVGAEEAVVSFLPRVSCPGVPPAPHRAGLEQHLISTVRRYLSESVCNGMLATSPLTPTYMAFLDERAPESEELSTARLFLSRRGGAPQSRKASTAAAAATARPDTEAHRVKPDLVFQSFDVSRQALDVFRVQRGQWLCFTTGPRAGTSAVVVGVRNNMLWVEDSPGEGAEELAPGDDGDGLVLAHGLWAVDRKYTLLAKSLWPRKATGGSRLAVREPLLWRTESGLKVFEAAALVCSSLFRGLQHGDHIQVRAGGLVGAHMTVLGVADGSLWCQPLSLAWPAPLGPAELALPVGDVAGIVRLRQGVAVDAVHTDARLVFVADGGLTKVYGGCSATAPFDFHSKHIVRFGAGPWEGSTAVVLGVLGSSLAVLRLIPEGLSAPVLLGIDRLSIVTQHAPTAVGYAGLPLPSAPPRHASVLFAPSITGEVVLLGTSAALSETVGVPLLGRVKVVRGPRVGRCGVVVGFRRSPWVVLDGDREAVPFLSSSLAILAEPLAQLPSQCTLHRFVPSRGAPVCPFPVLGWHGHVMTLDASPAATATFGVVHGQLLEVDLAGGRTRVAVVGVGDDALWFMEQLRPYARPFDAADGWMLAVKYSPVVRGVRRIAPWEDLLCTDASALRPSALTCATVQADVAEVVVDGEPFGLDSSRAAVALLSGGRFFPGDIIILPRRIAVASCEGEPSQHSLEGPVARVVGVWDGALFVLHQGASEAVELPPSEFPSWSQCSDHGAQLPKSGSIAARAPAVALASPADYQEYRSRVGPALPAAATSVMVWGCSEGVAFHPFERSVCRRLNDAVSVGHSRVVGDDRIEYNIAAMTFSSPGAEEPPRAMQRLPHATLQRLCLFHHSVDLAALAPAVLKRLQHAAKSRFASLNRRDPPVWDSDGDAGDVFPVDDKGCCDITAACVRDANAAVLNDLVREAATVSAEEKRQVDLRLVAWPAAARNGVACCMLRAVGVVLAPDNPTSPSVLVAVAERRLGVFPPPSPGEYESFIVAALADLESSELTARARLVEEQRRRSPSLRAELTSPQDPLARTESSETHSALPTRVPEATSPVHPYVTAAGAVLLFDAASPGVRLRRGDLIQFTRGDLSGTHAVVLGVIDGAVWRRELDGAYGGRALPFAPGSESLDLYGVRRVGSHEVPCCDEAVWPAFDGAELDMHVGVASCAAFGAAAGERYVVTAEYPSLSVCVGCVLAVVGVARNQLWVVADATGAFPLPRGPITSLPLRRLCWAPLRIPRCDPGCMVRCYGYLPEGEAEATGEHGSVALCLSTKLDDFSLKSCARYIRRDGPGSKKVVPVGVRLGRVYALQDGDPGLRALPASTLGALEPIMGADPVRLPTLPHPPLMGFGSAEWRFQTRGGVIAAFDTVAARVRFGVRAGCFVEYVVAGGGATVAQVVGVRDDQLWRIDCGTLCAVPFAAADQKALAEATQWREVPCPENFTPLTSRTW